MSSSAQRNLTLTEELERLEQSITLTLQEIDSNFSKAHRIVTTSILPIVEQYAEHSKDVWEGAKFWKQFFEASANVSLSGYEEIPNEDVTATTDHDQTATEDLTNTTQASLDEEAVSYESPLSKDADGQPHHAYDRQNNDESELDISSLTISPSHSTPRPRAYMKKGTTPTTNEGNGRAGSGRAGIEEESNIFDGNDRSEAPVTPGRSGVRFPHNASANTPMSSPFVPPPTISRTANLSTSTPGPLNSYRKPTDPVLHQVLDKTYRVQATPLSRGYKPTKFSVSTPKGKLLDLTSAHNEFSPLSSPELEAPKLRQEYFAHRGQVQVVGGDTPGANRRANRRSPMKKERGTPRPGISVLTPAKPRLSLHSGQVNQKQKQNMAAGASNWNESDDDDDNDNNYGGVDSIADELGLSPPKTMQFHIPHSRLMKTPAKEASKRIVSDLLATAGGGGAGIGNTGSTSDDVTGDFYHHYRAGTMDDEDDEGDAEHSPTIVRGSGRLEDDTF